MPVHRSPEANDPFAGVCLATVDTQYRPQAVRDTFITV
jgi:hypothetical protein